MKDEWCRGGWHAQAQLERVFPGYRSQRNDRGRMCQAWGFSGTGGTVKLV
jgi:hypothetical protein